MSDCSHEEFEIQPSVERHRNVFSLRLEGRCKQCSTPLRFMGLPESSSVFVPGTAGNETQLRVPFLMNKISSDAPLVCNQCQRIIPPPKTSSPVIGVACGVPHLLRCEDGSAFEIRNGVVQLVTAPTITVDRA